MADPNDLALIEKYWNLAIQCEDDEQVVEFFDKYPEAFEFETESLNTARVDHGEDLYNEILADGGDEQEARDAREKFEDDLENCDRKALSDEYKLEAFISVILGSPVYAHLRDRDDTGWVDSW